MPTYWIWAHLLLFFLHLNKLSAVTCGSLSTRCRAALPGWWRPSREPSGRSHSTARCLAGSVPSGGGFPHLPALPYQPSPPSLWARWQSRCCWWRARLCGPNAAETGGQVRDRDYETTVLSRDCCCLCLRVCVFVPRCNNCLRCLCKQRRCLPGLPGSKPAGVSQTRPAAYSSYRFVDASYRIPVHNCLMLQSYMLFG